MRTTTAPGARATRRALWIALFLTGGFAAIEAVAGVLAGSLALISDAGHMVTDAASFVVALIASAVAAKPPSRRASYGYARAEVLAAFVNALAMLALIVWIAVEAVQRLLAPVPVAGPTVMIVAVVGLAVNLVVGLDAVAWRGRHQRPRRAAARLRRPAGLGGGAGRRRGHLLAPGGCRSTRSCRSSSRC